MCRAVRSTFALLQISLPFLRVRFLYYTLLSDGCKRLLQIELKNFLWRKCTVRNAAETPFLGGPLGGAPPAAALRYSNVVGAPRKRGWYGKCTVRNAAETPFGGPFGGAPPAAALRYSNSACAPRKRGWYGKCTVRNAAETSFLGGPLGGAPPAAALRYSNSVGAP